MDESELSLITLPDVVLKNIFGQCDFLAITNLRKVCRDLRSFIEDTKVEPYHKDMNIILYNNYIRFQTYTGDNPWLYPDGEWIWMQYTLEDDGCSVSWVKGNKVIQKNFPNEDFINIFCQDFHVNTTSRKSILPEFYLHFQCQIPEFQSRFLENFREILVSRPQKLKVTHFQMVVEQVDQVIEVLKAMDQKPLEIINLMSFDRVVRQFEVEPLMELEQWRAVKNLRLENLQVTVGIEEFYRFEKVQVHYKNVPAGMVVAVKNEFLRSPTPQLFQLEYETITDDNFFVENFGQPFLQTDPIGNKKNWTFSIPDTDQVLSISIYSNFIIFLRIDGPDVKEKTDPRYFEKVWF